MKKLLFLLAFLAFRLTYAQTWTSYTSGSTTTQLPSNAVWDMARDKDGSMWFATEHGSSHFDGIRWKNDQYGNSFNAVKIDAQGIKWFGGNGGSWKYDGSKWINYPTFRIPNVSGIAVDTAGNKWFISYGSGVAKFDGTKMTPYSTSNGLITNSVRSIAADAQGNIWVGTESYGVMKFDGSSWTNYSVDKGLAGSSVNAIACEANGTKWFGCSAEGVSRFDGSTWTTYTNVRYAGSIFVDAQGNKWFCTQSDGVFKLSGNTWTSYTTSNGLLSNSVWCAGQDGNGDMWFGTPDGVSKLSGTIWTHYSSTGLPSDNVNAIAVDKQDNIWLGTTYSGEANCGLASFNGTNWSRVPFGKPMRGDVTAIAFDKAGNKWLGGRRNLYRFTDTDWTPYWTSALSNNFTTNYAVGLAIDNQETKWAATKLGLGKFDGTSWSVFNSPPTEKMNAVAIDKQNIKWMGTINGVWKYDGKTFRQFLPNLIVTSVAIDAIGNKWIGTNNGLYKQVGDSLIDYTMWRGMATFQLDAIAIDEDNAVWMGAPGNLYRFDEMDMVKYPFPIPYNLPYTYTHTLPSIAIDSKGNKWVGSAYVGLAKLSGDGAGPSFPSNVQVGAVFHDVNGNQKKDKDESLLPGQIIRVDSHFTTTQKNGYFYKTLERGNHVLHYRPLLNWIPNSNSSFTVTVGEEPLTDTLYFGVQENLVPSRIQCALAAGTSIKDHPSPFWISYSNTGAMTEAGTVSLQLDNAIRYVQATPLPDTINGNRLVWNYANLLPNERRQIVVKTTMPNATFVGDTLTSSLNIRSFFVSARDSLTQVVLSTGSITRMEVRPGKGKGGRVLFNDPLEYTIYFQTPSYTDSTYAINIKDTLAAHLDIQSLQIVASSLPVRLDLRRKREAIFRFENTKLPTASVDNYGSIGYVRFTISPKKNLAENTEVKNNAYVYFYANKTMKRVNIVATNQVLSTYGSTLTPIITGLGSPQTSSPILVFPNPTQDRTTLLFPMADRYSVKITNLEGKQLLHWDNVEGTEVTLSVATLHLGMYLYVTEDKDGVKRTGKLVVER